MKGPRQKALDFFKSGNHKKAEQWLHKALKQAPNDANCLNLLSAVYGKTGRYTEALQYAEKVVAIQPVFPQGYINSGNALLALGRPSEAKQQFQHAVTLSPNNPSALYNLAACCRKAGDLADAEQYYLRAIEAEPDSAAAHNNLGSIYYEKHLFDKALHHIESALNINSTLAEALFNRASTYMQMGMIEEAKTDFETTLKVSPGNHQAGSCLLLTLNYIPQIAPDELYKQHSEWGRKFTRHITTQQNHSNTTLPEKTIRVGYISPDFMFSAPAYSIELLLQYHNSEEFEIFCYSDTNTPDTKTEELRTLSKHWRDISSIDDAATAQLIQDDKIDILVDLNGHIPPRNRLGVFARKPAPIQITYLGYPNTSGLQQMDYRLTDVVCDPPGEAQHHTESLYRLSGSFASFSHPQPSPEILPPPCTTKGYITFGSLNNCAKLNHEVIVLWGKILDQTPNARLLIFRDTIKTIAKKKLETMLLEGGIPKERYTLQNTLPSGESHLNVYNEVDIALDPFPWNGHITTFESLWMGTPVITLYGNRHAARMCASVLDTIGLKEYIARTRNEYIEIATRLASQPETLSRLGAQLRNRVIQSQICNGKAFTKRVEHAFRDIWSHWCQIEEE